MRSFFFKGGHHCFIAALKGRVDLLFFRLFKRLLSFSGLNRPFCIVFKRAYHGCFPAVGIKARQSVKKAASCFFTAS